MKEYFSKFTVASAVLFILTGTAVRAQSQPNFEDHATREKYIKWSTDEISRAPKNYEYYITRGYAYLRENKLQEALADLNKANELEPNQLNILTTRAQTFLELKDWKSATTDYSAAIKLKPEMSGLYSNRGNALMYAGNLADARKDATRALQLDSQSFAAFELVAEIAYREGKYAECIKNCNEVLKRSSGQPDAFYYRGCAYEKLGNAAQGKADKEKASKLGFHGQMLYIRGSQ